MTSLTGIAEEANTPQRSAVFYGTTQKSKEWRNTLQLAGWAIVPAHSKKELYELLRSNTFQVGIAFLEGAILEEWESVSIQAERLCPIEWIALVEPGDLELPRMNATIARNFYDFHSLPIQPRRLEITLGRAYGMNMLRAENGNQEVCQPIVGQSSPIRRLQRNLRKAAFTEAPVLITGESGTGKELAAQSLHQNSQRKDNPFVAVNCGSLASSLIQSELFGYEKGAFTGADRLTIGKIEAADGGTLFLDEIGDFPLEQQVNLLRFLQEGAIQRVGGHTPIAVDVRVIAATHVNLEEAVSNGNFREDLYYRLNVLQLSIPPLRERGHDILGLTHHFFQRFRKEGHARLTGISKEAERAMLQYSWPGNIRELINRIRRGIVMSEGRLLTASDLGLKANKGGSTTLPSLQEARDHAEKEVLQLMLEHSGNNLSQAARLLGVSRLTLYRLLEKHDLREHTGQQLHAS